MANSQMESPQLQPIVEFKDDRNLVLAPTVGYYSAWPRPGVYVTGGCFIGTLKVLNTAYELYLPQELYGRVEIHDDRDNALRVEHGQELFRLNPDKNIAGPEKKTTGAGANSDPSETGTVITAFTAGIFYAKPSPDAPPFVSEGQQIEKGKALGLIEVMKTFNHIIFHGTDKSTAGIIKKVYVNDSQEVKLGQPLFLIE